MTLRHADEGDRAAIIAMGARFIRETAYRDVLTGAPERLDEVVTALLAQGGVWVMAAQDVVVGMLGVLLAPLPLTGERCAIEVMWWVEPEWRGTEGALLMYANAEAWARAQGAQSMQMVQPVTMPKLANVYRRWGYQPVETLWYRRLVEGEHDAP